MSKAFMGVRLRRIREERGLTQLAAARALGLSASYYNQLENDERPLTVATLLKVSSVFGVDAQVFSEEEEARLLADLREAVSVSAPSEAVSLAELREVATKAPAVARALVGMHQRLRVASDAVGVLSERLGDAGHSASLGSARMPFEEVRDFFYARRNHFPELEDAADALAADARLVAAGRLDTLIGRLANKHGIQLVGDAGLDGTSPPTLRRYDPASRTLRLDPFLSPGQRAFQLATQLAFLEADAVLGRLVDEAAFTTSEPRKLARIGLASYFAGALLMPYGPFLEAAERVHYDIDRLGQLFGFGFEVTCHRLSTLQRPTARGIPFFFVRVDRAGNVSKRQSATDFHFSRIGGTCPLWNVYEAFAQPGRILTQVAQMPDGRRYFWIARTVFRSIGGYGAPSKTFAIGLGCDLQHAGRLVYSQGLDLEDPRAVALIGVGCRVCERTACPQRAFPAIGRRAEVSEDEARFEPYRVERLP